MDANKDQIVNILITTFSGLSLPKTLSIPLHASTPISELYSTILSRLPTPTSTPTRYILTRPHHKDISAQPNAPLSTLLTSQTDTLLTLRLSIPLCGGKGGFGSQLRAAGGRMAKRRRKQDGEDNGSSRNLDGRRLRTVTEAKALAEYLAIKPDMERKVKEERRKRWAEVVAIAEKREEEIRMQGRNGKGKVSEGWLEDKDEAAERTREAVKRAMSQGGYTDQGMEKLVVGESASDDEDQGTGSTSSGDAGAKKQTKRFAGFDDDDDEFMSDESYDESNTSVEGKEEEEEEEEVLGSKGKDKGRAPEESSTIIK